MAIRRTAVLFTALLGALLVVMAGSAGAQGADDTGASVYPPPEQEVCQEGDVYPPPDGEAYPPPDGTADCHPPTEVLDETLERGSGGELSDTGAPLGVLAGVALVLLAVGAVAVLRGRRSGTTSTDASP